MMMKMGQDFVENRSSVGFKFLAGPRTRVNVRLQEIQNAFTQKIFNKKLQGKL